MANQNIPPIPYKIKMQRPDGYVSEAWSKFFRQLFQRVGGVKQDSGGGLSGDISQNKQDIIDLSRRIEGLEQEPVL